MNTLPTAQSAPLLPRITMSSAVNSVFASSPPATMDAPADNNVPASPRSAAKAEKKNKLKKSKQQAEILFASSDSNSDSEGSSETETSDFSDSDSDDSCYVAAESLPPMKQRARKATADESPQPHKKVRAAKKNDDKPKSAAKPAKPAKQPPKSSRSEPRKATVKKQPAERKPKEPKSSSLNISSVCSSPAIKATLWMLDALLPDTQGGTLLFGVIKPLLARFQNSIADTGKLNANYVFSDTIFMDLPADLFRARPNRGLAGTAPSLADIGRLTLSDNGAERMKTLFGSCQNCERALGDENLSKEELLMEACCFGLLALYALRQNSTSATLRSGSAEFHFTTPTDIVSPPPLVRSIDSGARQCWLDATKLLYDISTLRATPDKLANTPLLLARFSSEGLPSAKLTTFFSFTNTMYLNAICQHPLVAFFVTFFQYTYSRTSGRSNSTKVSLGAGEFSQPLSSSGEK